MANRRMVSPLFYFTVEDESMLAEAFPQFEEDGIAIAYKVADTDDVFVTTAGTREAMDRHDVPYNLLAEEDAERVSIFHTPLSREELGEHEDALRALALAYRSIGMACVGVNGEADLGFDLGTGTERYTYFTAPAGHTFIWRLFGTRDEAIDFLSKLTADDRDALAWAKGIPLASAEELAGYH